MKAGSLAHPARGEAVAGQSLAGAGEQVRCVLCEEGSWEPVRTGARELHHWLPGRFDVVRCAGCGLMRTDPLPTREAIGGYYPSSYTSYSPPAERVASRSRERIKALLWMPHRLRYGAPPEPADGRGRRLLDVGSGAGDHAARMAAHGWRVAIIEPNAELADQTRHRLGLAAEEVFAGSAEDAAFEDSTFDRVNMSHALEHMHEPRLVLEKVHAWLRPGGQLQLGVPNAGSWEAKAFGRLWHGLDVPRHLHHFDPSTLRRLLESTGFEVTAMVAKPQSGSLASSVLHVGRAAGAAVGRRRPYRRPRLLYYALLVPGSVLAGFGNAAYLDVTATRT